VYDGVDADAGHARTERIAVAADLLYVGDRVNCTGSSHSSAWNSTLLYQPLVWCPAPSYAAGEAWMRRGELGQVIDAGGGGDPSAPLIEHVFTRTAIRNRSELTAEIVRRRPTEPGR
jgi:hypothetical protein